MQSRKIQKTICNSSIIFFAEYGRSGTIIPTETALKKNYNQNEKKGGFYEEGKQFVPGIGIDPQSCDVCGCGLSFLQYAVVRTVWWLQRTRMDCAFHRDSFWTRYCSMYCGSSYFEKKDYLVILALVVVYLIVGIIKSEIVGKD